MTGGRQRGRAGQRADVVDLGPEKVNVALSSYILQPQLGKMIVASGDNLWWEKREAHW